MKFDFNYKESSSKNCTCIPIPTTDVTLKRKEAFWIRWKHLTLSCQYRPGIIFSDVVWLWPNLLSNQYSDFFRSNLMRWTVDFLHNVFLDHNGHLEWYCSNQLKHQQNLVFYPKVVFFTLHIQGVVWLWPKSKNSNCKTSFAEIDMTLHLVNFSIVKRPQRFQLERNCTYLFWNM